MGKTYRKDSRFRPKKQGKVFVKEKPLKPRRDKSTRFDATDPYVDYGTAGN